MRNVPKTNNKMSGSLFMDKLTADVDALVAFSSATLDELRKVIVPGDLAALIRVKECIAAVSDKDSEVLLVIDRTRAAIAWLEEKEGVQVCDRGPPHPRSFSLQRMPVQVTSVIDAKVSQALETWDRVKKQVPVTKGEILPLVKSNGLETRARIAAFEARTTEYRLSFGVAAFWNYSTGVDVARASLEEATARQAAFREECAKVQHIAHVFDLSDMVRAWLLLFAIFTLVSTHALLVLACFAFK
jgi:hypothetical protein